MMKAREDSEGGWRGWKKMKIVRKIQETSIHTSFYLAADDGGKLMKHKAGQYLTVRLSLPGVAQPTVRHYSLSSAPGANQYRITVKREEEGLVSSYLHHEAKEGDLLEVTGPAGDFFLDSESKVPQVFIAGGTGITPIQSMLSLAATQDHTQAVLLYRAHEPALHPLSEELFSLVSSNDQLSSVMLYTVRGKEPNMPRVSSLPSHTKWNSSTLAKHIPS